MTLTRISTLPRFLERALMEAAILCSWIARLTLCSAGTKKRKIRCHVTTGWVWFHL